MRCAIQKPSYGLQGMMSVGDVASGSSGLWVEEVESYSGSGRRAVSAWDPDDRSRSSLEEEKNFWANGRSPLANRLIAGDSARSAARQQVDSLETE